jgi:hypothetical protein
MRISYIGNFEHVPHSTENDVRKAFEFLGHEVIMLQENKLTAQQVRDAAFQSDLLLMTSSWEVLPLEIMLDIFFECAKKGIPTATLHLDTFWPTHRQGRGWWKNPMFFTSYIFTADGDWQDKWKLLGRNHIWLPPAVRHDAVKQGTPRPEYECDVAFVGSNGNGYHEDVWTYRKELVDKLKEMCHRNGWKFRNPGGENYSINMGKVDRNDDMNDFYASAKVTVGDSLCVKKEAAHYWSDRVPEATGRGGYLIMPQIDELNSHWPELRTYPWGSWQALEDSIRWALENPDDRERIRSDCQKVTAESDTYVNRAQTIINEVTK